MGDMNAKPENPKPGHGCLGFLCMFSLPFWIVSRSLLFASTQTSRILYYTTHIPPENALPSSSAFVETRALCLLCADYHLFSLCRDFSSSLRNF